MSPYTSFVAVDETARDVKGKPVTAPVALPVPEGTQYEGFFGAGSCAALGTKSLRAAAGFTRPPTLSPRGRGQSSRQSRAADTGQDEGVIKIHSEFSASSTGVQTGVVRRLALAILNNPKKTQRELIQLLSLQNSHGAFIEPAGIAAEKGDQAMALLAMLSVEPQADFDLASAIKKSRMYLSRVLKGREGLGPAVFEEIKKIEGTALIRKQFPLLWQRLLVIR
ncbi:MAG: hypothetical protein HY747_10785 [Elusimicrobia bacterium]|nr:hypothetical protein [Elusimicrobiota bacterium]